MKNKNVYIISALNIVIVLIIFFGMHYFSRVKPSVDDFEVKTPEVFSETPSAKITSQPKSAATTSHPKPTASITKTSTKVPSRTPTFTPTPVPTNLVFYENHFEDNSFTGWENRSGTPLEIIKENNNNYLHFKATGFDYPGFYKINGTSNWENYVFESRIRLHENGVFVCFRAYGKEASFYNVFLDPQSDWVVFADYDYYRGDDNYQTFNGVSYPIPVNRWFLVRLEVENENLRVYIDNKLVSSAKRSSLYYGGIGYYAGENTQLDIDDIRVWNLK